MNKKKKRNGMPRSSSRFPFAADFHMFVSSSSGSNKKIINHLPPHLEHARASTLNGLHLRLAVHRPPEPLGQLVAVPELALLGLHAAELSRGAAADAPVRLETRRRSLGSAAAHHGAVLAGFLAVGGEGLGEGLGG